MLSMGDWGWVIEGGGKACIMWCGLVWCGLIGFVLAGRNSGDLEFWCSLSLPTIPNRWVGGTGEGRFGF